MRLKEIEARLAQIRNELNTRAAELTAEEITALETEVTDLQEERTQIIEQAERRNKLLARIAAGEPIDDGQGGEGTTPTVLRNFSGAAGEGDDGDKYGNCNDSNPDTRKNMELHHRSGYESGYMGRKHGKQSQRGNEYHAYGNCDNSNPDTRKNMELYHRSSYESSHMG